MLGAGLLTPPSLGCGEDRETFAERSQSRSFGLVR
jgi:hypothetical protein